MLKNRGANIRNNLGWGLMIFLSLALVLLAGRYLSLEPDTFFPEQRAVYTAHLTALLFHIVGSMVALALGPFLLLNGLRARWPRVHRWLGRAYLLGVLCGGLAGLYMSMYAYTGEIARNGFATLALLWLTTGAVAYIRIREGNVAEHRRWMVRNFALTFAGVMLRLQFPLLSAAFGFEVGYMVVAWTSWLPNLLVAQWLIRQRSPEVFQTVASYERQTRSQH